MDRNTTLTTLTAHADDLCDPRQHVERVPYWDANRNRKHREWRTVQPGLLQQLYDGAVEPPRGPTDAGAPSVPGSRPPLALEALSVHAVITIAAHRWVWSLRLDQRDTVQANIRLLVGHAPTLDDDTLTTLAGEVRQWHRQASVATGWTSPLFAPRVACPVCEQVGKLRVNLAAQAAHCRGCQSTWAADDGSIYLLGEHVRTATTSKAA